MGSSQPPRTPAEPPLEADRDDCAALLDQILRARLSTDTGGLHSPSAIAVLTTVIWKIVQHEPAALISETARQIQECLVDLATLRSGGEHNRTTRRRMQS